MTAHSTNRIPRRVAQDPRGLEREQSAGRGVAQFLKALQVLLRSARLYQRNHPKELESLEAAERELRAALRMVSPLGVGVAREALTFRGHALTDQRGELKALAEDLSRRGVRTLVFTPEAHLGELATLARLLDGTPASRAAMAQAAPANGGWTRVLEQRRIRGIRINVPLEENRADAGLTSLVALLLGPELPAWVPGEARPAQRDEAGGAAAAPLVPSEREGTLPRSVEELTGVVELQVRLARAFSRADANAPQEAAQRVRATLREAAPRAVTLLVAAMTRQPPRTGETLEPYFFGLAQMLALDFAGAEWRAHRVPAAGLRQLFARLGREFSAAGAPLDLAARAAGAPDEVFAECLQERFWAGLTPEETTAVLRSREAWCVPVAALAGLLEELADAGGARDAKSLMLGYARCLSSEQTSARLAAATGLSELAVAIERLWPDQFPAELSRSALRALVAEAAPEAAAILSAVVDHLARLAIRHRAYGELESILETLEQGPRSPQRAHLPALAQRLLQDDRWEGLVEAALAQRSLDAGLSRILGRHPERLLDSLADRLSGSAAPASPRTAGCRGLAALPAMSRLLRAIGEPVYGALAARVFDPRAQRTTAAVKLLTATQPERLLEVLPRALPSWDWNLQDMAVGELVRLNTPGCARAFLATLEHAHPLVVPMMLDEIGLARETAALALLLEIAAGHKERLKEVYVRIKAVEALGRLRAAEAADLLRQIVRERNGLTYVEPAGLRAAAEEALGLIENRPSSARVRTAQEALEKAGLAHPRPRRYLRVPLESPLAARIEGATPAAARVSSISLGGAFLESSRRLTLGDSFAVDIKAGLRHIHGTAVVRNITPSGGGVEFVHMKQEEREKLRKFVNALLRG